MTHQSLLLDELDGWRFVAERADQSQMSSRPQVARTCWRRDPQRPAGSLSLTSECPPPKAPAQTRGLALSGTSNRCTIGRNAVQRFEEIFDLAAERRGGSEALRKSLAKTRPLAPADIAAVPDHQILSSMTRRVFYAGFSAKVIDAKLERVRGGLRQLPSRALRMDDRRALRRTPPGQRNCSQRS